MDEGTAGPGDVMILVRKRGPFVEALNREMKRLGVPAAGSDRLVLTEHIAVMDLVALGRFMLLPEDDLSLAAVLKARFSALMTMPCWKLPAIRWNGCAPAPCGRGF
ncbi:hypothetical protein V6L77_13350 [Pannonibacter sp. Pt2-lr]